MGSLMRTIVGSMVGVLLVLALGAGVTAWKLDDKEGIAKRSWLHIDLYGDLPAYDPPAGLTGALGGGGQTLQDILTGLQMAAVDERIAGVVLQLSASHGAGAAKLQEIRQGVQGVRAAGKPVLAYADAIDLSVLFAAAACDSSRPTVRSRSTMSISSAWSWWMRLPAS